MLSKKLLLITLKLNIMKNLLSFVILFTSTLISYSQNNPYWIAGGNPFGGIDGVNGTNNTLGTDANFSLRIETNNTPRLLINNGGTTSAAGRIAIGNNLAVGFIPRSRLHLHHNDISDISLRFSNSSIATYVNNF